MGYLDAAASIAGAFGRGYDQFHRPRRPGQPGQPGQPQQGQVPQRPQDQNGGLLGLGLNYMRNRHPTPAPGGPVGGSGPIGPATAGFGDAPPPPAPGPMGPIAAPPLPDFVGGGAPQAPAAPQPNAYPGDEPVDPMAQPTDGMRYARGGVVTRPTTALLGEDGPEMVVPLTPRPGNKVSMNNLRPGMTYRR